MELYRTSEKFTGKQKYGIIKTPDYEKCVRAAINLGYDTDTTAAVAGGLAGIYYGFEKIPNYYLKNLAKATWIFKSAQLLQNVVSKQLNY